MSHGPLVRHPELAVVDTEDQVVLLRLETLAAPPVVLDDSGADIWRLIDGQRDLDALVGDVAACYGVGPTQVHEDVSSFVAGLRRNGLLAPEPQE